MLKGKRAAWAPRCGSLQAAQHAFVGAEGCKGMATVSTCLAAGRDRKHSGASVLALEAADRPPLKLIPRNSAQVCQLLANADKSSAFASCISQYWRLGFFPLELSSTVRQRCSCPDARAFLQE